MADKTTTLKTKTNDNVYPNVIGDNRDNAIVDSAHINHTLTKDHKINFRLDTNVSNLIFNSLQKPSGLTKTKLVGVGTNGQENIEIGDNLTLANGKLSATGGGSGGNKSCIIELNIINDTYTSNIPLPTDISTPVFAKLFNSIYPVGYEYKADSDGTHHISIRSTDNIFGTGTIYYGHLKSDGKFTYDYIDIKNTFEHFITLTKSNEAVYFIFKSTREDEYNNIHDLISDISYDKLLATGTLGNSNDTLATPMYVTYDSGDLKVYYALKSTGAISSKVITEYTMSDQIQYAK